MNCAICKHGQTSAGMTTVNLNRGKTCVVIRNVPAEICDNCGEYYLDDDRTAQVLEIADAAAKRQVQIEVCELVA
ncbi:MAG: type II toxin-antitoxin system MqsA family antitoxin [Planctomycetota bacterium]|jgi:YgiT-type zinc finger domain-containing protein|nr:type II toxin-antitoxin system MqsA family antitoxin [Planctomycetota bacterium]